jgi:hypothetical protein
MREVQESPLGLPDPEWQVDRFRDHDAGRWSVTFVSMALPRLAVTLTVSGDDVTSFEIHPRDHTDPEPLTAVILRRIPFGALAAVARSRLSGEIQAWQSIGVPSDPELIEAAEPKRPGRRGHPDLVYARLAVAYQAWLATGQPITTLAEQQQLSVQGLRTRVAEARRRGFLTPAPPGRKGGLATDRARQIIKEGHDDGID